MQIHSRFAHGFQPQPSVAQTLVFIGETTGEKMAWEVQAIEYGADERNRTSDLLITNQLLYQLSYISTAAGFGRPGCRRPAGPDDSNAARGCPVPPLRTPGNRRPAAASRSPRTDTIRRNRTLTTTQVPDGAARLPPLDARMP